jgi:phage shock protein PspC (stress-responsive transcriptional regulator)
MDKSVKINLAGTLFQVDEEAYHLLRDYLQAINARLKNVAGGNETIDDIEARISEIFQNQQGNTGTISKENVGEMIGIIGKPEDFDINESPGSFQPRPSSKRRLYRNPDDSIISGVCGGLGAYLGFDPVWLRLIFILFTFSFGIGLFVYLALWIALPSATSDLRKRELYGDAYHSEAYKKNQATNAGRNTSGSGLGDAFNEIFRAIWKVCFIILRIFSIVFGVLLVLTGFMAMIAFIMILFFKNPAFFSSAINGNLFYLPDLLDFIVNPSLTPWICFLFFMAIILPLLAIIYWGIKMIFWFRSRDGIISLAGLVLWVLSVTALSIILAGEGLSFAEHGRMVSTEVIENAPKTVYILTDHKVSDLKYDREVELPDDSYFIYSNNETKELSIRVKLRLYTSDDNTARLEVVKSSGGRSRADASKNAESLVYNYSIKNDTIMLDEYFSLPRDKKWTADEVRIRLWVPEGTQLYFDNASENIHAGYVHVNDSHIDYPEPWDLGGCYWTITGHGLEKSPRK